MWANFKPYKNNPLKLIALSTMTLVVIGSVIFNWTHSVPSQLDMQYYNQRYTDYVNYCKSRKEIPDRQLYSDNTAFNKSSDGYCYGYKGNDIYIKDNDSNKVFISPGYRG